MAASFDLVPEFSFPGKIFYPQSPPFSRGDGERGGALQWRLKEKKGPQKRYWELVVGDLQRGWDILEPVCRKRGNDLNRIQFYREGDPNFPLPMFLAPLALSGFNGGFPLCPEAGGDFPPLLSSPPIGKGLYPLKNWLILRVVNLKFLQQVGLKGLERENSKLVVWK